MSGQQWSINHKAGWDSASTSRPAVTANMQANQAFQGYQQTTTMSQLNTSANGGTCTRTVQQTVQYNTPQTACQYNTPIPGNMPTMQQQQPQVVIQQQQPMMQPQVVIQPPQQQVCSTSSVADTSRLGGEPGWKTTKGRGVSGQLPSPCPESSMLVVSTVA